MILEIDLQSQSSPKPFRLEISLLIYHQKPTTKTSKTIKLIRRAFITGLIALGISTVANASSTRAGTIPSLLNTGRISVLDLSAEQQAEFGIETATNRVDRLRDVFERRDGNDTSQLGLDATERARLRLVTAASELAAALLGNANS